MPDLTGMGLDAALFFAIIGTYHALQARRRRK